MQSLRTLPLRTAARASKELGTGLTSSVPNKRLKGAFHNRALPYLLLLPQLVITITFFIWPAIRALEDSLFRVSAFGTSRRFSGLANFVSVLLSGTYWPSAEVTIVYSAITTLLAMALGLFIAVQVDQVRKGRTLYRTLMVWTYAVPSAVAGALWLFLFTPVTGVGSRLLDSLGAHWNFNLNAIQALVLVIAITVWQQAAYNFLFFTAGLQAIPGQLLEAATVDGAGPIRRFWSVTFPLLAPTTFYLLVMNIVYVFFYTFGIIDIVTQGGPHSATETLVYSVYQEGFQNLNEPIAAAETVLLLIIVAVLTVIQFRAINRRVHYL